MVSGTVDSSFSMMPISELKWSLDADCSVEAYLLCLGGPSILMTTFFWLEMLGRLVEAFDMLGRRTLWLWTRVGDLVDLVVDTAILLSVS